ncbi:MAG: type I CRISPR-associated protein Cas7, partial [Ruminococcus sp.]|nr:type I CRISPR-associated protein Cas7 [Ruminococcus sp.]
MSTLKNKIDFVALVTTENANPNGDPLNGNRPRITSEGLGVISDVCVKRKLRNRLQDIGEEIFVQSTERGYDDYKSLS